MNNTSAVAVSIHAVLPSLSFAADPWAKASVETATVRAINASRKNLLNFIAQPPLPVDVAIIATAGMMCESVPLVHAGAGSFRTAPRRPWGV